MCLYLFDVIKSEGFMKNWLRRVFFMSCISFSLARGVSAAVAVPFHNGLSLQGFTGILNTPSAHVTAEGDFYALYSNQEESKWRQITPYQDNYMFSVGLFNFIELGGRLFEAPGVGRDLSANLKVTSAPLTRNYPYVPVIAAGMQDLAGGATFLKTSYLVLSEDIWRLRISAGYGRGPERMKGVFAGGEFKAHDWVYLLGEYDTKETNVGARVVLPQFWKVPVSFTATAKTSLNYQPGNFEVAVGLSLPLDFKVRNAKPVQGSTFIVQGSTANSEPGTLKQPTPLPAVNVEPRTLNLERAVAVEPAVKTSNLHALRDRLIREGFLNVRVGTHERTLVVEYENTIFNHNELDALGLVAGLACEAAQDDLYMLRVVMKRRNIRMAAISVPLKYLRVFLERPEGLQDLRDHLVVDLEARGRGTAVFASGDDNSGMFNTSLVLAPGLTTFVGTEVGVFDYLLSLKPELTTTLWKGAAVTARWDVPISWSDNLEDGKLYRSSRQSAQLERLMLFQAMKPLPSVMLNLGAGMIVHGRYGMLNEAAWSPGDGEHRFRIAQGWNEDGTTRRRSDLLLGSYRYYYSPLDLSLEGTAGKFWAEDEGISLELKRFFEDTAVSIYYKDTKGTDHKRWQAAGVQFSFPLTPRRDMKPMAKIQVRGSDEWSYAQETTFINSNFNNLPGNYLPPYPLAFNPLPSQALYRVYFDRDRLNAAYIRQHLDRLRDAWLKYGDKF
jgi:hypothetical protein